MPRSTRNSKAAEVDTTAETSSNHVENHNVVMDQTQALMKRAEQAEENVFLFVPNLIGYTRVILAALSLYYMKGNPKVCTLLYGVSCLLDAFDGMAARALGQSTKFGAVLDMVTDRCTTACLLCFLTAAYPRCAVIFQGLITLDFSSHYIHMYSSLITGSASHKIVTSDVSKILWYYYNDSRTLFCFCAGNELFFVCLYLMDFYNEPLGVQIEPLFGLLPTPLKSSWLIQLIITETPKLSWPQILGALTFPICAAKQIINCVQFWKAAKVLVGKDLEERQNKQLAKKA